MLPKRQRALDVRSTYYIVTLSCGCAAANAGTAFDAAWNARFDQWWWTNSASRSQHVLSRPPSASGTDILQLRRTARCISFLGEEVTPRFTWIPNTGPIALPRSLSTSHATALTFLGRKPPPSQPAPDAVKEVIHIDTVQAVSITIRCTATKSGASLARYRRPGAVVPPDARPSSHATPLQGARATSCRKTLRQVTPVQWQEREANQLPETGEMTSTTPRRHRGISLGFDHVS